MYKSASDNSASQDFLGKFCLFFAKFRQKNCEIWLTIDEFRQTIDKFRQKIAKYG